MAAVHIQHIVITVLPSTLLYLEVLKIKRSEIKSRFKCSIKLQHQHQHEPKANPCQEIETSERYALAYLVSTQLYIFWNCIILWNGGGVLWHAFVIMFTWFLLKMIWKIVDTHLFLLQVYKEWCAYVSCLL